MNDSDLIAFETTAELTASDKVGAARARMSNRFRMNYKVTPGLHVLGQPDAASPVLVSANYKLSFDALRGALGTMDAWILVLDTKGINVWCAAGEGTFGTAELISKIEDCQLSSLVSIKRVIVPQLGAPGVDALAVREATGFSVVFGPVRARDLPAFIDAGNRATAKMRTVEFGIRDRLVLTPMEFVPAMKYVLIFAAATFSMFGLAPAGILFSNVVGDGVKFFLGGFASVVVGTVVVPAFLPFFPFRSFAMKGALAALVPLGILIAFAPHLVAQAPLIRIAELLLFPAVSSYLALNFTGSTTFTNLSGVQKELKIAVPVYLSLSAISFILIILNKILTWRA